MSMEQLQKENDELRAHVERLRDALFKAKAHIRTEEEYREAREAYEEAPSQSLNHLLAQVEEETIERCVEQIRKKIDSVSYDVVKDALEYIAELFEVQPRKYKEQSDV